MDGDHSDREADDRARGRAAVTDVLSGPILRHGPRATQFEEDLARYTGALRAILVSSCTDRMHLVYVALGGTGEDRLDFTYVRDLVDGMVRGLGHPAARNQTFNLTDGIGRSVNEMLGILRAKQDRVRALY